MLMSKAAYAKHRGVSRQTVYDWITKGDVVMSGTKIDVAATERQTEKSGYSTLDMTWAEFWKSVRAGDGKLPPPATDEAIQQCVKRAADELGYSAGFLEDDGILLEDGDAEHYFTGYDLKENAWLAIRFMVRKLNRFFLDRLTMKSGMILSCDAGNLRRV
ncbi:hypothetical protein LU604_03490 [Erwinia tracheiphila]|uniref:Uncharacterized protein n=1 Tax=Erwinia tracheiphila TaxID=65700 RepID=A0A345CUP9_9GAMM|nr:hypothetical protein [Erwinia tracheiphila]AXF77166.1 hypothetical protein AV903_15855 [Erwinia tracheiphila]UIA84143.1 hypothetical protein LU604_03490 [Erwinia tracheiphila]UIA92725.1 hypothetical protein LU632_03455 [Erwinia tracheiphila]